MVRVVVLSAFAGAVVSAADVSFHQPIRAEAVRVEAAAASDVDCELSAWKPQECDTSTHTQVFERTVTKEVSGNGRACGALTETRPCNPVDCRLSAWSPWSACQDDGFSVRTRKVVVEPQFGGRECQPTTDRVLCGQAAEQRRLAGAVEFPSGLKSTANSDSFHMTPIRVVQARVQSDKPKWDADNGAFGSTYYTDFEGSFRGLLDTVNTASVEGALMYVQAEGINEAVRGTTERCTRKNKMKYVVFYDMVIAQTNETLALFNAEYGTYLAMDGGQCTPTSGTGDTAVYPDECYLFNGDKTHPIVGPFVGGEARDTDERAPYPNTWWFSFPNSCPLQKWGSAKTDACRSSTRTGLCNYDTKPDGVKCTFNYRVLGWIPIDDLVGITSMKNAAGATYANFSQFCNDGGVEFKGTTNNTWIEGIDFWKNPRDSSANAARATKLVSMYNDAIAGSVSLTQVSSTDFANFKALPSVSTLTAANPPCYKHIKSCATAKYGCKRSLYGQICTECSDASDGCVVAPSSFTFPAIAKATLAPTTTAPTPTTETPSPDTSTIDTPTADTTTAPTPSTSTKSDTAATPSTNTGSAAMATSVASLTTVAIAFVLSCQL